MRLAELFESSFRACHIGGIASDGILICDYVNVELVKLGAEFIIANGAACTVRCGKYLGVGHKLASAL